VIRLATIACVSLIAACGFGDNSTSDGTGSGQHRCGDGVVDPGEGCDDGNTVSGDGCSSTCQVETNHPVCGNGILETGEECDDGNTMDHDGCSSTCHIESCTLVPQTNCSTATPACDITGTGDIACRAVTTPGTELDHCPHDTDCAAGYTCQQDDAFPSKDPFCLRLCLGDLDCSGVGSRCLIQLTDVHGQPLPHHACSNACDPVHQTGCPSGMGCDPEYSPDSGPNYTECLYVAGHADGSLCTDDNQCRVGSVCVTDSGSSTAYCYKSCVVTGGGGGCPSGETCMSYATPLPIGTKEYGFCQ
jgi:cysteine-rich repeat protein